MVLVGHTGLGRVLGGAGVFVNRVNNWRAVFAVK